MFAYGIITRTVTRRTFTSPSVFSAAITATMGQKRPFNEGKRHFKKNKKIKAGTEISEGSNEEVLLADVRELLKNTKLAEGTQEGPKELPELGTELQLDVSMLSSTGDGLAEKDGHVYVVPFTTPGDTVLARVYRRVEDVGCSVTDFLKVITPSPDRTETPRCRYFTQCSGCQFQQLSYSFQLAHKQKVVEKAYRNFSQLPPEMVPTIGETIGSPLQYAYRTKLTPHFDGPPGAFSARRHGTKPTWSEVPPIGFMKKGTRKTMDIEECPIGTPAVQKGMTQERKRVTENIGQYVRGATLLLRETTEKMDKEQNEDETSSDAIIEEHDGIMFRKTCITDSKAISTEFVDDFRLENPAGSFFQNNNSILPVVTQYIRDNILGKTQGGSVDEGGKPIKNMIDAYCGSGLFTVALSKMFTTSIGIDIAHQSIDYASKNARLNHLPDESTKFIAADANELFASIDTAKFPPAETAVVIDPPRKGCDRGFVRQLMSYGPNRICYVSCNVHTQARDVGWLVGGLDAHDTYPKIDGMYEIESVRGFDFFPQTSHVEGVAMLRRKKEM